MAKEITSKIDVSIGSKGGKAVGSIATTEDSALFYGFNVTAGTTASAINLGVASPKLVFIQNNDANNYVEVDNVITMNGWPQKIKPGAGVLLRPPNGTLFGRSNLAPVAIWIVAG
jgi:hypothetical protein